MIKSIIKEIIEEESFKTNGIEIIQVKDLERVIEVLEEDLLDTWSPLTVLYNVMEEISKADEEARNDANCALGTIATYKRCLEIVQKEIKKLLAQFKSSKEERI